MPDTPLESSVRRWTLKNAQDYGAAVPGKVMSKVLGEVPDARKDVKALMALIGSECARVNALGPEGVKAELAASGFTFEEKPKEEGERRLALPGAVPGAVVTRFPPEPSGYPHIGHAKAAFLNFEAARQAGGHMRLRMDDTNPEKEKQEFVEGIVSDLRWLGISWAGDITYTSDYMPKLYEFADELILKQRAYVCTCPGEQVKKGREKGEECLCRAKFPEENVHDFRRMMEGKFDEGQAILRFRGEMKAENTVMRDPTLFRIIKAPHYRQGERYKAWPSYDFAAPIIDSLEGVTHAMRSKEYELREEIYFALLDLLELRKPTLIHFSRLEIAGAPVSKRLITPLIAEGKVSGYDDPRLPTLSALRRRGIRPEAIRAFALSFGLTKVESEPGWDKLLSENRKLVDPTSPRRFFVADAVRLEIAGAPQEELTLKNHPQNPALGARSLRTGGVVFIAGKDAEALAEGETFRLKDWCNVRLVRRRPEAAGGADAGGAGAGGAPYSLEGEFVSKEGEVARKIQWVPDAGKIAAEVFVPGDLLVEGRYNPDSKKIVRGYVEPAAGADTERATFQFERFGFVTLDKKDDKGGAYISLSS